MSDIWDLLVSVFIQLGLFSLIPVVVWFVMRRLGRTGEDLFPWVGIKPIRTNNAIRFWITFFAIFAGVCLVSILAIPLILGDSESASSQFRGQGTSAVPGILIFAIIQTGLSEEILFRGFIGKRLIASLGFAAGNLIQATLFGLMHGALFLMMIDAPRALALTIMTGAIGWIEGWLNEKRADGSIIPSWIFHALTNIAAGLGAAFG